MTEVTRSPCPDAATLAAFIDGQLPASERPCIDAHLVECEECREVVGETVRFEAEASAAATRRPHRVSRRLVGGAGLLLAAAAAVILIVRVQRPSSELYVPEMAELVAAVGTTRPIEPRLTGGFKYGPAPSPTRGGPDHAAAPEVRIAAARIDERAGRERTAAALHAQGIASIVTGDMASAISALESAASMDGSDARIQADLAAAYLVRGATHGATSDRERALTAAVRGFELSAQIPEVLFNRALALEANGLDEAAHEAWQDYLSRDPDSEWGREARSRADRLRR